MSEEEYNDLVRNAAAKRQMVVRALQKKHSDVEHAVIEDCVEGAIIKFSDREKILNVLNPEKPFRWLLSTAEHFFQHERRRHSREISLNELAVEPVEPDREIESFEASEHTDAVFGMIHKNYSDILIAIEREGFSLEEIAGRESKPIKAIYNRYERAKIKAKKAANKLEPKSPPPARIMPIRLTLILKIIRNQVRNFVGEVALYRVGHFFSKPLLFFN